MIEEAIMKRAVLDHVELAHFCSTSRGTNPMGCSDRTQPTLDLEKYSAVRGS